MGVSNYRWDDREYFDFEKNDIYRGFRGGEEGERYAPGGQVTLPPTPAEHVMGLLRVARLPWVKLFYNN